MTRLTRKRLAAISEALVFRTAGPIEDVDDLTEADYEKAFDWVCEEQDRRETALDQNTRKR